MRKELAYVLRDTFRRKGYCAIVESDGFTKVNKTIQGFPIVAVTIVAGLDKTVVFVPLLEHVFAVQYKKGYADWRSGLVRWGALISGEIDDKGGHNISLNDPDFDKRCAELLGPWSWFIYIKMKLMYFYPFKRMWFIFTCPVIIVIGQIIVACVPQLLIILLIVMLTGTVIYACAMNIIKIRKI